MRLGIFFDGSLDITTIKESLIFPKGHGVKDFCLKRHSEWSCTRPKNHEGIHEAGWNGEEHCFARWSDDPAVMAAALEEDTQERIVFDI